MEIGDEMNGNCKFLCLNVGEVVGKFWNIQETEYQVVMKNYFYEKYIVLWEKVYDIII